MVQSGHTRQVRGLVFTPDGRHLVTAGYDQVARLWDVESRTELRTYAGHSGLLNTLGIGDGGRMIVTGSGDGTARLWDLASGEQRRRFTTGELTDQVFAAALGPDGKYVATGHWITGASIWDAQSGKRLHHLQGHARSDTIAAEVHVYGIAITPDGKHVLTAGDDATARLWDIRSGEQRRVYEGHKQRIFALAVSADGKYFVTGGYDRTVQLWDLEKNRSISSFAESAPVYSLAFSPDGRYVAAGLENGSVSVWDLQTGVRAHTLTAHAKIAGAVAFSPDGRTLATGGDDAKVVLWNAVDGKRIAGLEGNARPIDQAAFSPDGKHILALRSDRSARLWDTRSGKELRSYRVHWLQFDEMYEPLAFAPDGRSFFVNSVKHTPRRWSVDSLDFISAYRGHTTYVTTLAVSPDNRLLLSGGQDSTLRLWEVDSGKELKTLWRRDSGIIKAAAFSPDGKLAAAVSHYELRIWDVADGRLLHERKHSEQMAHVWFSPDGRNVVTAGGQYKVSKVVKWDAVSGQKVREYRAEYPAGVYRAALAPDGRNLLTVSGDQKLRVLDLETGNWDRVLFELSVDFNSVSISPDGKFVLTGSADGTARIWDFKSGRELCRLVSGKPGEWVVATPEGLFDGSPEGLKTLYWTTGDKAYPLEAFSENHYSPGLLARILAGMEIKTAAAPDLSQGFKAPPSIEFVSPRAGAAFSKTSVEVEVLARDMGGGIDEIRLYHNGKALGGSARDIKVVEKAGELRRKFHVALLDGENRLRAVALSGERIESAPAEIAVTLKAPQKEAALHLLAVGINKYRNPALNLNYAVPDAKGLAGFFAQGASGLFRSVREHTLYDQDATKAAILAKLKELENTAPQDVVVVYLAGHGESLGNTWYFLPHELIYPEREDKIKEGGLSSAELQERIRAIGARKVLLLMDACKSGGALLAFAARGFEERKALAQLARAAGVHVVAASSQDQIAAEVKELGHGVFTHTLLGGLGGKADGSPKDGTVTVRELLSYVENVLPEISQKYKAQPQFPVVDSRGMDFPLTRPKN